MDEVISPTLTIKIVGLFIALAKLILSFFKFKEKLNKVDGLKLYILNKMKDTKLIGKKNNTYYPAKLVSASFSVALPSSPLFLSYSCAATNYIKKIIYFHHTKKNYNARPFISRSVLLL
jgi:hypothetical protein